MNLQRYNVAGIAEFRRALAVVREDPTASLPQSLIEGKKWTEPVKPAIEIACRKFKDRRDAANYFQELLGSLDTNQVRHDAGLWTWLTHFFFDEICPALDSKRTVKNDYYYVFDPYNVRHSYRHLLYISWRVLDVAPEFNRLFLDVPVNALDKATADVMKRLFLTRIPCVFEVLDKIYWEPERGKIRSGMVSPGREVPGDLIHRFPNRIRQLEMTYDLQSLSAEQLLELLGDEFDFNKPATVV